MSTPRQILAAIFDMDGLLIDSEPLWDRAELEVMASLGVDISRRNELPDTCSAAKFFAPKRITLCTAATERNTANAHGANLNASQFISFK